MLTFLTYSRFRVRETIKSNKRTLHARIQKIPSERGGGGGLGPDYFSSHQRILQRSVRTSPEKQLDPIASRGRSVRYF